MESFLDNFHGILIWILNEKENKEVGTNCFEVTMAIKNYYGTIPSNTLAEVFYDAN